MTSNAEVSRLTIDAIADQNFTGSSLTPAIIVKDDGTALTLGTHYSVAYANNINAGTATVTITGMGNYIGTKSTTFTISSVTLATNKNSFKEGETITITANRSAVSVDRTVINFAPTGTATKNTDYNFSVLGYNSIGITVAGGNGSGSAANQLSPYGIVVDGSGNLYVSDTYNHRVQKWAPGATVGVTIAGGNGAGSAANQLDYPVGMVMDGLGNLYIVERFNHRVTKWAPGATLGVTVAGGNGDGSLANQLSQPYGITIDALGNLYVADRGNHRIQKWAPGATLGVTVAGGNGAGSGANQLNLPFGIAIDVSGNL
jgi:hypothetical protein